MSKAVSALQGAVYQGYVEVREMGLQGMIGEMVMRCDQDLSGYAPTAIEAIQGHGEAAWRALAQLIGRPRIMKAAVATGMSLPALMRFVVQVMTELSDRPAHTWEDRASALLDALTQHTRHLDQPLQ